MKLTQEKLDLSTKSEGMLIEKPSQHQEPILIEDDAKQNDKSPPLGSPIMTEDSNSDDNCYSAFQKEIPKKIAKLSASTKNLVREARFLYDYLFQPENDSLQKLPETYSKSVKSLELESVGPEPGQKAIRKASEMEEEVEILKDKPLSSSYEAKNDAQEELLEYSQRQHSIDENEVEVVGFSKRTSIFESSKDAKGTVIEGIADISNINRNKEGQLSMLKDFKMYNPQQRKREEFWNQKKDHFVCQAGASKQNYNELITEELGKLLKYYTNEKDLGRM